MPICHLDINEIFYYEFVPSKKTVNQTFHLQVFNICGGAFAKKRPNLWPDKWIFHHGNVTPTCLLVSILAKMQIISNNVFRHS
jgi:hypothetical protein